MPLMTVTICVLNAPDLVEMCLSSVLRHTLDCEVLVTDNASEPPTASLLRTIASSDNRVHLMRNETNQGFIGPQNAMVQRATGRYVCVLNSDVQVGPDWMAPLIGGLNAVVAEVGPSGGYLRGDGSGYTDGAGPIDYVEGWCFTMETARAKEFGPFDEEHLDFAYGEDADLSMRLREAGYCLGVARTNIAHRRYASRHDTALPVNLENVRQANQRYIAWRWGHMIPDLSGVI